LSEVPRYIQVEFYSNRIDIENCEGLPNIPQGLIYT
jgi:predicted HTH transcriptional regulator